MDKIERRSLAQSIVDFPLVAMVIGLVAVIVPSGLVAGFFERVVGSSPMADRVGQIAVVAVMIASYKLVVPHLGERQHDDLSGPGGAGQLAAGLVVGAALFAVIVVIAWVTGSYQLIGVGDASNLYPALIANGLFPAVTEEIIYRGILFRWIEEFAGSWAALIISSVLFGLSHIENPNADAISTVGLIFEAGLLLGGAYMLTRRLWLPMGIHAAWNLTQGEVFDVPVSGTDVHGLLEAKLQGPVLLTGGGFGLEGSVIGISVGTAAGVAIVWLAVRRGAVIPPRWIRLADQSLS